MKKKDLSTFESKKSIHFTTTRETHSGLRIMCFQKRLTMQEVFEELAQRIISESSDMMNLMEDLSERKRLGLIKKLSDTDAESLFNIIEKENPLSE